MSFVPSSFPRKEFRKPTRQAQFRVDETRPTWRQDEREIDIISIPAIGADAAATWTNQEDEPWLVKLRDNLGPARLLLYDHLTHEERALEPQGNPDGYAAKGRELTELRISNWADRFWNALLPQRDWMAVPKKPILFVCHSSGGIVLKEALTRLRPKNQPDLTELCYGIVFFATPHHKSDILSESRYATAVKNALGLKWALGEPLRRQLSPGNHDLELLNQRFSSTISLGIRIWNYIEDNATPLRLEDSDIVPRYGLSSKEPSHIIVGPISGEESTIHAEPLDDEDSVSLSMTHVETARLADEFEFKELLESIQSLTQLQSLRERRNHKWLLSQISDEVKVSIHKFVPIQAPNSGDFSVRNYERSLGSFIYCPEDPDGPQEVPAFNGVRRPSVTPNYGSKLQVPTENSKGRRQSVVDSGEIGRKARSRSRSQRPRSANRSMSADVFVQPANGSTESINIISTGIDSTTIRSKRSYPQGHEPITRHTPRPKKPFTWFNVPYSVSSWVRPVMAAISHHRSMPKLHKQVLLDQLWNQHHNRSRHGSVHAQFVRPHFQALLPRHDHGTDELLSPSSATEEPQLALFFPYMHWDTFEAFKLRRRIIENRSSQEEVKPVTEEVLGTKNIEHKLIWQHLLNSRAPMHGRRTLDQYRYPALRSTKARDEDQVLYKKTKPQIEATPLVKNDARSRFRATREKYQSKQSTKEQAPATMMMVDTLWLWILSDEVLTFAPKRESVDENPELASCADLKTSIMNCVTGAGKLRVDDCFDLAALIVLTCITQLLDDTDYPNLEIFKIFEEYISELTEAHTEAFKDFKDNQERGRSGYDNRKDLHNLLELRDISDELQTIEKLLKEQRAIVDTMHDKYKKAINKAHKGMTGLQFLTEAQKRLDMQSSQVKDMLDASTVAQASYEKLLDMKQAQSSVLEAHASAEQTRVVTVFTVVTIIFSPLSFFTSLFGMNVVEWSGEPQNPDLWFILKIIGGVSLGVIVIALMVGFHRTTRGGVFMLWHLFISLTVKVVESVSRLATLRTTDRPRTIKPMVPNKLIPALKKAQQEKTPTGLGTNHKHVEQNGT